MYAISKKAGFVNSMAIRNITDHNTANIPTAVILSMCLKLQVRSWPQQHLI